MASSQENTDEEQSEDQVIPITAHLSDAALKKAAELMALPRAWGQAVEDNGRIRWNREYSHDRHGSLIPENYARNIRRGNPIQVSMLNYINGSYVEFQKFAVFDLDSDLDPTLSIECLALICEEKDRLRVSYLNCDSGVKGYHNWTFFSKPLNMDQVLRYQSTVISNLADRYNKLDDDGNLISGFMADMGNSWYYFSKDYPYDPVIPIRDQPCVHIESQISGGDGKMIKAIFSPHLTRRDRLSLPMTLAQIRKQDRSKIPGLKSLRQAENLILRTKRTPAERIVEIIGDSAVPEMPTASSLTPMRRPKSQRRRTDWEVPKPEIRISELQNNDKLSTAEIKELNDLLTLQKTYDEKCIEMELRLDSVPCLKESFESSVQRRGSYWRRVNIVLSLGMMGYSMKEIAYFIRHHINNDDDNANVGELEYQVERWHGRRFLSRCDLYQNKEKDLFCCPSPCGRRSPHQRDANPGNPQLTKPKGFDATYKKCESVLDIDDKYTLVKKTTRSGFTTALPIVAHERGLRVLLVEPRTSITERTFSDLIKVAGEFKDHHIEGVVLSSNMKACLLRCLDAKSYETLQLKKLYPQMPVPRGDCAKCIYAIDNGGFPVKPIPGQPLYVSDVEDRTCMLETYRKNRGNYHIGAITYKKLQTMLDSSSEDTMATLEDILTYDVIVLDEISQFVETSDTELILYQKERGSGNIYDFLSEVNSEMKAFATAHPFEKSTGDIEEFVDEFVQYYRNGLYYCKHGDDQINILQPDKMMDLRKKAQVFQKKLYDHYLAGSKKCLRIWEVLNILCQERWVISRTSSSDYNDDLRLIVPPKYTEVIDWLTHYTGKVIVTDATLPYTNLKNYFHGMTEFYFGDPQGTAEKQLIVSDSRNIINDRILIDEDRLRNYVDQIIAAHDKNSIMVVCPNKRVATKFKKMSFGIPYENITYQRSNETIGVASNLRVMLVIGGTYAPANTFDWMSKELKSDFSISSVLWHFNARNTMFQTISRVKDPLGKDLSVVYVYGMKRKELKELIGECVGVPHIAGIPTTRRLTNMHIVIGKYWLERGVILNDQSEIQILSHAATSENLREVYKPLGESKSRVIKTLDKLGVELDDVPELLYNSTTVVSPPGDR